MSKAEERKKVFCKVCGVEIPKPRVEALLSFGYSYEDMTCLKHSDTQKYQAIYNGDLNNSGIRIVKKVENDSIKNKFTTSSIDDFDDFDESDDLK